MNSVHYHLLLVGKITTIKKRQFYLTTTENALHQKRKQQSVLAGE